MKSFLQHLQEDDKQIFTTTRKEVMQRRGMGDPEYLDALKKFRADPKNAELLKPFALPSVDSVDLNRPIQVQYGAPGAFGPRDRQAFKQIEDYYGFVPGGFAVRPGDALGRPAAIRINSDDSSSDVVGEFNPKESKPALTKKDGKFVVTMRPESTPPRVSNRSGFPVDVIGHEASHITQFPKGVERPRVVPPLAGDTPENKKFREYLLNTDEPAARANEYKAWLQRKTGKVFMPDAPTDEFKKAIQLLKSQSQNDEALQTDLEFYGTPQGEALFRGAKANLPEADPTKNKPVKPATTATALAEHWSRMTKNYK